jgi:hypothetical protein
MGTFPYPIFVAYASQVNDIVYTVTTAMIAGNDAYKDGAPGASGLAVDKQTLRWVLPIHPAATRAIEEAGKWSTEDEAHNDALLRRQQALGRYLGCLVQDEPSG